jgi:hypothetical protein
MNSARRSTQSFIALFVVICAQCTQLIPFNCRRLSAIAVSRKNGRCEQRRRTKNRNAEELRIETPKNEYHSNKNIRVNCVLGILLILKFDLCLNL